MEKQPNSPSLKIHKMFGQLEEFSMCFFFVCVPFGMDEQKSKKKKENFTIFFHKYFNIFYVSIPARKKNIKKKTRQDKKLWIFCGVSFLLQTGKCSIRKGDEGKHSPLWFVYQWSSIGQKETTNINGLNKMRQRTIFTVLQIHKNKK